MQKLSLKILQDIYEQVRPALPISRAVSVRSAATPAIHHNTASSGLHSNVSRIDTTVQALSGLQSGVSVFLPGSPAFSVGIRILGSPRLAKLSEAGEATYRANRSKINDSLWLPIRDLVKDAFGKGSDLLLTTEEMDVFLNWTLELLSRYWSRPGQVVFLGTKEGIDRPKEAKGIQQLMKCLEEAIRKDNAVINGIQDTVYGIQKAFGKAIGGLDDAIGDIPRDGLGTFPPAGGGVGDRDRARKKAQGKYRDRLLNPPTDSSEDSVKDDFCSSLDEASSLLSNKLAALHALLLDLATLTSLIWSLYDSLGDLITEDESAGGTPDELARKKSILEALQDDLAERAIDLLDLLGEVRSDIDQLDSCLDLISSLRKAEGCK